MRRRRFLALPVIAAWGAARASTAPPAATTPPAALAPGGRAALDRVRAGIAGIPLGRVVRHHDEARQHRVALTMPADAFPIVSDYRSEYGIEGTRRSEMRFGRTVGAPDRLHRGIDVLAPRGCPVIAVADGDVQVFAADLGGHVVILDHEIPAKRLTWRSMYAHLDRVLVAPGRRVARGDVIGLVGNSGRGGTDTPHLHFEAGDCCRTVNPHLRWYDGAGRITCLRPGRAYADHPERFVYPLPATTDLDHFFAL